MTNLYYPKWLLAAVAVLVVLPQGFFPAIAAETAVRDSVNTEQEATLQGNISDANIPTYFGLHEVAIDVENSGKYYSTMSGYGSFNIKNLKPGKTIIAASKVGYYTYKDTLDIAAGTNIIYISLTPLPQKIDSSVVSAERQLVRHIGDTIRFDAAAVNTAPDEYAISILRQLPGISIENGEIKAFGSKVARTYVNGIQIFGSDPLNTFSTLKADQVTSVDVYDEDNAKDKHQGILYGRKEKVMNVRTKDPVFSAMDIYLSASGGADTEKSDGKPQGRYAGRAAANFYSEMFLAYLKGDINNIGRSYNDSYDMYVAPQLTSYTETANIGAGIEKYWKDRSFGNFLTADYQYGKAYTKNASYRRTEYFATDEMPATTDTDTSENTAINNAHTLNIRATLPQTPLKMINIAGSLTFSDDNSRNSEIYRSSAADRATLAQNERNSSGNRYLNYDGQLYWEGIGWGKLIPSIMFNAKANINDNWDSSIDTLASSYNKRILKGDGRHRETSLGGYANLKYVVLNKSGKTMNISGQYRFSSDDSKSSMYYYDHYGYAGPQLNTFRTYDYTWHSMQHSALLDISYYSKGINLSAGIAVVSETQKNRETMPVDYSKDYSFLSVQPRLRISLLNRRLTLDIKTSTQTPALEQLRARINDTNPLRLAGGNPDLKQIYTLDAAFNYSTLPSKKGNFFQAALNFSTKFNDIVYRTDYFDSQTVLPQYDGYTVNPGTMLTTYVNESGTINASGFVTYVWSIPKTRSRIQFTLRDNYTRRPHYDGNVLNMLQSNISGGQIDLSWRKWKNVVFSLPVKADYVNSVSLGGRTESMKISISPYVNANFAKYMFASVRYNFSSDFFLNRDYPDNFDHILSAEIGCRLLNRRITMSISGQDLVHKGSFYSFLTTSNYLQHTWEPSFGRYLLFNIRYRFTSTSDSTPFMGQLRQ